MAAGRLATPRLRYPTVALVGADGAGKTTIAHRLPTALSVRVEYIYMGPNHAASNYLLPSNRLLRYLRSRLEGRCRLPSCSGRASVLRYLTAPYKLANQVAEGLYRQRVAERLQREGALVIFDRHPFADYPDRPAVASVPWARRIRHAVLRRAVRPPDLLIYLDAPAGVLLRRKGEGTLASLARLRAEYRKLIDELPFAVMIDANRSVELVSRDVAVAITDLAVPEDLA